MSLLTISMLDKLSVETDAPFDINIWKQFRAECAIISEDVIATQTSLNAPKAFDIVPITENNRHIIAQVDILLEKEFPKHGGALCFLLSTIPFPGLYDPLAQDHVFHNCLQYWAFVDKKTQACVGTCGVFLMNKNHKDVIGGGWLALSQEYRGHGLGRSMLEFVTTFSKIFATRNGQKTLECNTSDEPHVQSARQLYKSIGAKEVSFTPNPYVPGSYAIHVELDLFPEKNAKENPQPKAAA